MEYQEERIVDLIYRLKEKCIGNEQKFMKEENLSHSEFNGIEKMNPGEIVSGKHFSRKMELSPSRASRVVDRMVQKNFIIRDFDKEDRRKCKIILSEKGIKIKKKIDSMRLDCERKFQDIFSQKEIESFGAKIKKTIKIL